MRRFTNPLASTFSLLLLAFTPCQALKYRTEKITADFDDRTSVSAAAELNKVGMYSFMNWTGFSIDQPRNVGDEISGVPVQSAPNYIGGVVPNNWTLPAITSNYTGSEIVFFDLESFYWGCSVLDPVKHTQSLGWCTLEVYGYPHGAAIPTATAVSFFFPPDGSTVYNMVKASMPSSFRSMQRVEFNVLGDNPVLYLDDVTYTMYNVTSLEWGLGNVIHDEGPREQIQFDDSKFF